MVDGSQLNTAGHCHKNHHRSVQVDRSIDRLNGHSKDFSEETKDALKYTILCKNTIIKLCGAVVQSRVIVSKTKFMQSQQIYHFVMNYSTIFTSKNQ